MLQTRRLPPDKPDRGRTRTVARHDTAVPTRLSRHGTANTTRPTRQTRQTRPTRPQATSTKGRPTMKTQRQLPPREARAARKDPDTAYTAPITARKDPDTAVPTRLTRAPITARPARHAGGGKPVCQGHWRHDWTSNTNTVFLTRSNAEFVFWPDPRLLQI